MKLIIFLALLIIKCAHCVEANDQNTAQRITDHPNYNPVHQPSNAVSGNGLNAHATSQQNNPSNANQPIGRNAPNQPTWNNENSNQAIGRQYNPNNMNDNGNQALMQSYNGLPDQDSSNYNQQSNQQSFLNQPQANQYSDPNSQQSPDAKGRTIGLVTNTLNGKDSGANLVMGTEQCGFEQRMCRDSRLVKERRKRIFARDINAQSGLPNIQPNPLAQNQFNQPSLNSRTVNQLGKQNVQPIDQNVKPPVLYGQSTYLNEPFEQNQPDQFKPHALSNEQSVFQQNNQIGLLSTDQSRLSSTEQLMPSSADQLRPSSADQLRPSSADQLRPSSADQLRPSSADQLRPLSADQLRPSSADQQESTLNDKSSQFARQNQQSVPINLNDQYGPFTIRNGLLSSIDQDDPSSVLLNQNGQQWTVGHDGEQVNDESNNRGFVSKTLNNGWYWLNRGNCLFSSCDENGLKLVRLPNMNENSMGTSIRRFINNISDWNRNLFSTLSGQLNAPARTLYSRLMSPLGYFYRTSDDFSLDLTVLPVQFNKDYSLALYNNSAYLNQKLARLANEYTLMNANESVINDLSSSYLTTAVTGGFTGQVKSARLGLMNSILGLNTGGLTTSSNYNSAYGLNAFAVSNRLIETNIISQNSELYITYKTMSTSLLCMTTVCIPTKPVDIISNAEFVQCSLSCLANPRNALSYFVYKNYNDLTENLSIKKYFTSKLQSYLTYDLVNEGLLSLISPDSGMPGPQIREIDIFRKSLLSKNKFPPNI